MAFCGVRLAGFGAFAMTYVLGEIQNVGGYQIAIVSHQTVTANALGTHSVYCQCDKQPSFVLIRDRHILAAMDISGSKVAIATIAALCPAVVNL